MKTHDCKAIRREIDEANLDGQLTLEASEHLTRCDQCRRFHDDRRTLRYLMADLETIGAPADFDFRLRARLARERPSNGFSRLLLVARPIAAVMMVILIAVVAVVVRSRMSSAGNPQIVANTGSPKSGTPPNAVSSPTTIGNVAPDKSDLQKNVATVADLPTKPVLVPQHNVVGPRNIGTPKAPNTLAGNARLSSTRESAGSGAAMITPGSFGAPVVVPIDAQAFRLSVDNGHGGARTIFLPPVSFGSQRLLAREASFVPVSSGKGDW